MSAFVHNNDSIAEQSGNVVSCSPIQEHVSAKNGLDNVRSGSLSTPMSSIHIQHSMPPPQAVSANVLQTFTANSSQTSRDRMFSQKNSQSSIESNMTDQSPSGLLIILQIDDITPF